MSDRDRQLVLAAVVKALQEIDDSLPRREYFAQRALLGKIKAHFETNDSLTEGAYTRMQLESYITADAMEKARGELDR